MSFRELQKRRAAAAAAKAAEEAAEKAAAAPVGHDVSTAPAETAVEKAAPVEPAPSGPAPTTPGAPAREAAARVPEGARVLIAGFGPWAEVAEAVQSRANRLTVIAGRGHRTEWPKAVARLGEDWVQALGDRRYGAVLAAEPLTHDPDPLEFLRAARSVLAPDGVLVAVVPNVAFGDTRLALVRGEFSAEDGTLHHYTFRRLRELLATAGFEVAEVHRHRARLFAAASDLTPELFPEALVKLVASDDEADVTHFVVTARPASPEAIVKALFAEQDHLRALARNELARATRTHEALTERLKEADAARRTLEGALEASLREEAALKEFHGTAEANIRTLTAEADAAVQELSTFKRSWAYKLMRLFGGGRPKPVSTENEPGTWVYDET